MIPWGWLLVTLFGGAAAGMFVMALCVVARRGDEEVEIEVDVSEAMERAYREWCMRETGEVTPDGDVSV